MSKILENVSHRPWPLPDRAWVMHMSWERLAFLHWRADPDLIRRQLPYGLDLDCFDGSAWIGVVPFRMNHVRGHWLPEIPPTNRFLELNLRTYVTRDDKPGVWFFSLDAESRLAVRGARTLFHLPYFDADMKASNEFPVDYRSVRTHAKAMAGGFDATYEPVGDEFQSQPGTLERWLTERYCLYAADDVGGIWRGEVHHAPWPLRPGKVEIRSNTLGDLPGIPMGGEPESVLCAKRIDVLGWALERC